MSRFENSVVIARPPKAVEAISSVLVRLLRFARNDSYRRIKGFTLIELLVVISIIAILAAAIIPNFVGFDKEAKIAATKSNLDTIRSRITLYRAKEGRYPATLQDLVNRKYLDAGARRPYLKKIPAELLSRNKGSNEVAVLTSDDPLTDEGGWVYLIDTAEVIINLKSPLDKSWGDYADQIPSEW